MHGIGDLFGRHDIVDAQWRIVEPILGEIAPPIPYEQGSWGPDEANQLIGPDRPWHNPLPPCVQADLAGHLTECYGADACNRYWDIFEEVRHELGYADYLGALERFRLEKMHDPRVLLMSSWLVDYPFGDRIYKGALSAVQHVQHKCSQRVIIQFADVVQLKIRGLTAGENMRVSRVVTLLREHGADALATKRS
jgi:glucose-6-phosphate dehydrogenase-like protein